MLILALTARLTSTAPIGRASPKDYAKYDDITVTSQRPVMRAEHRRTRRAA